MGAIINFFTTIADFFATFASNIADGLAQVGSYVSMLPVLGVPIMAIIAMYVIYAIIGRS